MTDINILDTAVKSFHRKARHFAYLMRFYSLFKREPLIEASQQEKKRGEFGEVD